MNTLNGKVVSQKTAQTVVVEVHTFITHPKYKKRMARTKRFLVHDELGLHEGDMVKFAEVSPISKMKRWKALEVIKS
ncbi:MAG: 30S ribosomal protein S17 [bacterium]|nr:30S ribosomal protein S17 [bacterium]